MAQSAEHPTLPSGSGRDLRVAGVSPALGSGLSVESAPDSSYLCPSLFIHSLSLINNL